MNLGYINIFFVFLNISLGFISTSGNSASHVNQTKYLGIQGLEVEA